MGERVSVRGFGSRAQFGVRGAEVVVDGIPASLPDGQTTLDHVDIGSLGAVEALRGPASSLYGNGAGGVLLMESRPPPSSSFGQEAEVVVGSHGFRRLQSVSGGRRGPHDYLLSLGRLDWEGFRANPLGPEGDEYGGATRHHVNAGYGTALLQGRFRATFNFLDLDAENPGSVSDSLLALPGTPARAFNVRQRTGKEVSQAQLGLRWRGGISGTDAEIAAWGIRRDLVNPIPPSIVDLDRLAGGIRTQVRRHLPGDRGFWVLGAEWERQSDGRLNFENEEGRRGARTLDQDEDVSGLGAFGQLSLEPLPRLRLVGGLRYDRIRFEVDDRFTGPEAGPDGDPDDSGSRVMDALSPSAGLHWEAHGTASFFGSVSTVFETPTTTELANRPDGAGGFNPELEPQEGTSYEVGVRGSLPLGTAYELVLFRTELEEELVPFEVPGAPGRSFFRNAGASIRNGAEAVLFLPVHEHFAARLTYSWIDATFEEFRPEGTDLSGKRIPGLAPHRAEGLLTGEWNGWYGELRGEYVDDIPVDDANTAATDAYGLLDLRLGTSLRRAGPVYLSVYAGVTNLLDEDYVSAVAVNAFGDRFFEPGPGRSFFVGAEAALP